MNNVFKQRLRKFFANFDALRIHLTLDNLMPLEYRVIIMGITKADSSGVWRTEISKIALTSVDGVGQQAETDRVTGSLQVTVRDRNRIRVKPRQGLAGVKPT